MTLGHVPHGVYSYMSLVIVYHAEITFAYALERTLVREKKRGHATQVIDRKTR